LWPPPYDLRDCNLLRFAKRDKAPSRSRIWVASISLSILKSVRFSKGCWGSPSPIAGSNCKAMQISLRVRAAEQVPEKQRVLLLDYIRFQVHSLRIRDQFLERYACPFHFGLYDPSASYQVLCVQWLSLWEERMQNKRVSFLLTLRVFIVILLACSYASGSRAQQAFEPSITASSPTPTNFSNIVVPITAVKIISLIKIGISGKPGPGLGGSVLLLEQAFALTLRVTSLQPSGSTRAVQYRIKPRSVLWPERSSFDHLSSDSSLRSTGAKKLSRTKSATSRPSR
jgi:hypothetical protein